MSLNRIALMTALAATLACGGASSSESAQASPKVIAGCGIEFELPEGWELTRQSPDSATRCQITLDLADHALRDSSDIEGNYIVGLETFKSQFDSLMDRSGFVHGDSGWVAKGRQGMESPAVAVARGPWRGVQGVPTIGCFSKSAGTYAGLCDVPVAALISGDFAVFLEGGPEAEPAFTRVLATLKVRSGK
jgi:hypothetical protein